MPTRVAIYGRSSPDCSLTCDHQIERLKTIAGERGWTVINEFSDRPMAVRKGLDRRPGELALLEAMLSGDIDKVLVWSICRIGRSLAELIRFMEACRKANVTLSLYEQDLDTEQSSLLFDAARMMALHLRQSRRSGILRRQAAARSMSVRFGRPPLQASRENQPIPRTCCSRIV